MNKKPKDLGEVSVMIRSLVDAAEEFNRLCKDSDETDKHVKEACFDMHIQILEFLRDSIKYIRAGDQNAVGEHLQFHMTSTPRSGINT